MIITYISREKKKLLIYYFYLILNKYQLTPLIFLLFFFLFQLEFISNFIFYFLRTHNIDLYHIMYRFNYKNKNKKQILNYNFLDNLINNHF